MNHDRRQQSITRQIIYYLQTRWEWPLIWELFVCLRKWAVGFCCSSLREETRDDHHPWYVRAFVNPSIHNPLLKKISLVILPSSMRCTKDGLWVQSSCVVWASNPNSPRCRWGKIQDPWIAFSSSSKSFPLRASGIENCNLKVLELNRVSCGWRWRCMVYVCVWKCTLLGDFFCRCW